MLDAEVGMDPLGDVDVRTPPVKVLDVSIEVESDDGPEYVVPVGPTAVDELEIEYGAEVGTEELEKPREGVEVAIPPVRLLERSVDVEIVSGVVDDDPVGATEDDEL